MRTCLLTILATLMLSGATAGADGLLYNLPPDGAWVKYDIDVTMGQGEDERKASGTLKISSVGKETLKKEGAPGKDAVKTEAKEVPCRWIEVAMTLMFGERTKAIVCKVLVPEKHLKKGEDPLAKRVRGWIRMGADESVEELTESRLGPMNIFLARPLKDVKVLEPKKIETKLGVLECKGSSGSTAFEEGMATSHAVLVSRFHDKSPFGVVWSDIKVDVKEEEKTVSSIHLVITIESTGTGAKSALPKSK